MAELLERYDPDGLELDWARFGYHLTPGREGEEGEFLAEVMRRARARIRAWPKNGEHPILLGIRVRAHADAAAGLGTDAVRRAHEGLVGMIVPCPFWTASGFDIPIEFWHERLVPALRRVAVVPGIEHNARPFPGAEAVANDLGTLRGFAASAYYRGADSLYLFNWMNSQTRPVTAGQYGQLLREGLSNEAIRRAPRRHPVGYRDTVPPGFPNGAQLPADALAGRECRIPIGPAPEAGRVWAVIGLARREGLDEAQLTASLHGHALETAEALTDLRRFGGAVARAVRGPCPLAAARDGLNRLHVRQVKGSSPQQIVWVEIRVEPR